MSERYAAANTDKELWRKVPGDHYSPRIHVTEQGAIGINVGGYVIVAPVEKWHKALQSPQPGSGGGEYELTDVLKQVNRFRNVLWQVDEEAWGKEIEEREKLENMIKGLAAAPVQPDVGKLGWKLAMRVMQSDLYPELDDEERAECDALVKSNPYTQAPQGDGNG